MSEQEDDVLEARAARSGDHMSNSELLRQIFTSVQEQSKTLHEVGEILKGKGKEPGLMDDFRRLEAQIIAQKAIVDGILVARKEGLVEFERRMKVSEDAIVQLQNAPGKALISGGSAVLAVLATSAILFAFSLVWKTVTQPIPAPSPQYIYQQLEPLPFPTVKPRK